jgi:hypothetical protein
MLGTIKDLLEQKKVPRIDPLQMFSVLRSLFSLTDALLRIQVAEVVYRHDHDHPSAFDLFLACTLPLAQRAATRKASKLFIYPSDWQIEVMYDGAVTALITLFQRNFTVKPGTDSFRRYIIRSMALGTVRSYFMRRENDEVRPIEDLTLSPICKNHVRGTVEQEIITRELLHKVTNLPDMPARVSATLQCIAALGPDVALKERAYTASGDPDHWKRNRGTRPILDPGAIAEAMGVRRRDVHRYLCQARAILREQFNPDGRLFLTR